MNIYLLQALLALTAIVTSTLGGISIARKGIPGSNYFGILMFAVSWWSICDALAAFFHETIIIERISLLSYVGILSAPLFWLLFTLEFSGFKRISLKKQLPLIVSLLIGILLFIQLNDFHHLIYKSSFKNQGDFSSTFKYGPAFWGLVAIIYASLFSGSFMLVLTALRSVKMHRQSIVLVLIAAIIPWIGNILYLYKLIPIAGFDITPMSFALTGMLVLYAIYNKDLFSLQPLAYQKLFSHLSDAVFLFDSQKNIVDTNTKAKDIIKSSSNPIEAKIELDSLFEFSIDAELDKIDLEKEFQTELKLPSSDSTWFLLSIRRILNKRKDTNGFMMSVKDISDWKRNELGLQINAHLLSIIGLLGEDMLRKGDWRSVYDHFKNDLAEATQAFSTVLHIPKSEQNEEENIFSDQNKSEPLLKIIKKSKKDNLNNLIQVHEYEEHIVAQFPLEVEHKVPAIWLFVWEKEKRENARMLVDALKLAANILASGIENNETSKSLKQSREDAIVANNAKSEFLSIMSHEIRTPLNAIIGLANILKEEITDPELKEKLNILDFSANNLHILVNDILDYNKIEAGKLELIVENFNLVELVKNIIQENNLKANELENKLNFNFPEELPKILRGDRLRISQVLNNLVSNAVKFTKAGNIDIAIEILEKTKEKIQIRISVKDEGRGMPPEFIPKLFSKFTQISTSSTRQYGGTGLGLAIAKRLLDLMNGTIEAKSELHKGSEFIFTLPLEIVKQEESAPEKHETISSYELLHNKNILLVEDNSVNVFVAKTFLKKWKCECDVAENGAIAIQMVSNKEYDLILMDLQMPVMDGYEATRKIREFNTITPIIALTASALLDSKEVSKLAGMNDYVTKPFKPDELYQKLVKYCVS